MLSVFMSFKNTRISQQLVLMGIVYFQSWMLCFSVTRHACVRSGYIIFEHGVFYCRCLYICIDIIQKHVHGQVIYPIRYHDTGDATSLQDNTIWLLLYHIKA